MNLIFRIIESWKSHVTFWMRHIAFICVTHMNEACCIHICQSFICVTHMNESWKSHVTFWMRHVAFICVTHMNEACCIHICQSFICVTYEWVMEESCYILNEACCIHMCHTYEWGMLHSYMSIIHMCYIWMSHGRVMLHSEWGMLHSYVSHIGMSYVAFICVTHMNEACCIHMCHTYEWGMLHSYVSLTHNRWVRETTHMNKSYMCDTWCDECNIICQFVSLIHMCDI